MALDGIHPFYFNSAIVSQTPKKKRARPMRQEPAGKYVAKDPSVRKRRRKEFQISNVFNPYSSGAKKGKSLQNPCYQTTRIFYLLRSVSTMAPTTLDARIYFSSFSARVPFGYGSNIFGAIGLCMDVAGFGSSPHIVN